MAIHHQVSFIAKLAVDPELRAMPSGVPVYTLKMPVNETYESHGERKEETTWYAVEFFGEQADRMEKRGYQKGDWLFVQGKPSEPRTYPKKDGTTGVEIRVKFAQVIKLPGGRAAVGDFEAAPDEEASPVGNGAGKGVEIF